MDNTPITVDCSFPGGNIIIDDIQGDHIVVHQDLRDTTIDWFYYYFRVRGAAGRTLTITFLGSAMMGARGPAFSLDGGGSWHWLGIDLLSETQEFTFRMPEDAIEVRFCFGIPYLQADYDRFLFRFSNHVNLISGTLCTSRKGRPVEMLQAGCPADTARYHVILTSRHHCCEMMASFCLEGVVEAVVANTPSGTWLQENVAFLVIPFMDKDGVEDGDQGKCRFPHDHNRDYIGESIYSEVAALRSFVPIWSAGKVDIAFDLHCPWIKGFLNEFIYFVGGTNRDMWVETNRFGEILSANRCGAIPFYKENNLPFGFDWNTGSEPGRKSFAEWGSELPGIRLANTIEFPYANVLGVEVNPESARAFGRDLGNAIAQYLMGNL